MKVIFLDVDGVLNSQPDCKATKYKMLVGGKGCIGIYKPRVRNLAAIVKATDAKIVLVSSWKDDYISYKQGKPAHYGKYLREKLRELDLEIYDTTYYYEPNAGERGTGIKKYLATHQDITDWVILDDEIFCDYDDIIMEHLVKTSFYYGALDEGHVEKAIKILNE